MKSIGTWRVAGHIGVDSGQVMLIDPCYVTAEFEGQLDDKPGLNYAGACKASLSKRACGNFGGNDYTNTIAFCTSTAHGDGVYPVLVRRNAAGRVVSIRIDFDSDD